LGRFCVKLVDLVKIQQTDCFPALFALIEQMVVGSSPRAQDWACLVVLEGLQNQTANAGLATTIFEGMASHFLRRARVADILRRLTPGLAQLDRRVVNAELWISALREEAMGAVVFRLRSSRRGRRSWKYLSPR
jgi:hypothetical protein